MHESNKNLDLSMAGRNLIKKHEDFKDKAYLCPAKVWTIGYGHTAGVKEGDTCTREQAENWLTSDVSFAVNTVKRHVDTELTQNQFDALVSFVFNIGPGKKGLKDGFVTLKSGGPSTLLRLVNAGRFKEAGFEFLKWTKAGGVVLGGLTTRRREEKDLFMGVS